MSLYIYREREEEEMQKRQKRKVKEAGGGRRMWREGKPTLSELGALGLDLDDKGQDSPKLWFHYLVLFVTFFPMVVLTFSRNPCIFKGKPTFSGLEALGFHLDDQGQDSPKLWFYSFYVFFRFR